eukprot:2812554-Alexandrium_andersonii.AAC.1
MSRPETEGAALHKVVPKPIERVLLGGTADEALQVAVKGLAGAVRLGLDAGLFAGALLVANGR